MQRDMATLLAGDRVQVLADGRIRNARTGTKAICGSFLGEKVTKAKVQVTFEDGTSEWINHHDIRKGKHLPPSSLIWQFQMW